jgi:hypothetical protein
LGYLFKSHDKQRSQRNLVAYLTASIMEDGAAAPPPPFALAGGTAAKVSAP